MPAIRVTSGGDAVIRRRVPTWADIAPLMAGPDLDAHQDGAGDAKAKAAAWLEKLEKADKIGANLSGEPEQMGYQGKTTFHEEIHLNKTAWTQLSGSGWHELFIALVHESFHAAHSDVHDAGGYIADAASFRKRPADVKYRNASHYEEVFRRLFKINPVGGVFKPGSDDDDDDALDIVGRGRMDATLLRLSRAEAWTLHARQRRPADPLPPVTMIDLVLAEGVAKRLIKAQQWVINNAPKDVRGWYAADPWQKRVADLQEKVAGWIYGAALQAVGPITASLEDDWNMLAELKAVHDNIRPAQ